MVALSTTKEDTGWVKAARHINSFLTSVNAKLASSSMREIYGIWCNIALFFYALFGISTMIDLRSSLNVHLPIEEEMTVLR